jgi:hypothetical protein
MSSFLPKPIEKRHGVPTSWMCGNGKKSAIVSKLQEWETIRLVRTTSFLLDMRDSQTIDRRWNVSVLVYARLESDLMRGTGLLSSKK